jgi:hypothetical protein
VEPARPQGLASTFQTTDFFKDFDAQFGGAVFFNNQVELVFYSVGNCSC